ncbi:GLIPR1-like protein 2 [Trichinella pseudospiralis]|uniref:GLIPR1-like protein 2 n=1 Tax=Trichinella pseudospiralis TaxID=6337 RepID=A0A0V1JF02_TRIPS|nr:GLIPR1-like protein 2 [Trichinella pseudospiralis]KRZ27357.1 GLIPR1-like protein 2 [Trichinella pseudospiralis]KRZ33553.1 GLIPR1-like protein 2 [Trichinella pseudospiralis]
MSNSRLYLWILAVFGAVVLQGFGTAKLRNFTKFERGSLVGQHNIFRASLEGGNMRCMRGWSSKLEAFAREVANNCSAADHVRGNSTYGLAYAFRLKPDDEFTPEEFVEELYSGANEYDYEAIRCTEEKVACESFIQFAWFETTVMGCAIADCENVANSPEQGAQYFGVCAYDIKADLTKQPYVAPPACTFCPQNQSICSNNLCCHLDLNAPADCGDQEIPSSAGTASMPKNLVPLTRLYNSAVGTNYFSINKEEIGNLTRMGYRDLGVIGRIANGSKDSECKNLVPIYHLYSPIFRSDYYMTDPLLRSVRLSEGYHDKGILGYTAKGLGVCNSDVPIYEFFKREQGLLQMPNSTEVMNLFRHVIPGYVYQGISFPVWKAA